MGCRLPNGVGGWTAQSPAGLLKAGRSRVRAPTRLSCSGRPSGCSSVSTGQGTCRRSRTRSDHPPSVHLRLRLVASGAVGATTVARLRPKPPFSRQPLHPVVVLFLSVLVLSGCGGSSAKDSTAPRIEYGSFHSEAVAGSLHYSIALPPGYDSSRVRYPVVYFLHGLPASDEAYKNIAGYADSLARTDHRAIVVGAQGHGREIPTRSGTTGVRDGTGRRRPRASSLRTLTATTARSQCARPARSSASRRGATVRR